MIGSAKYQLSEGANAYYRDLNEAVSRAKYKYIINPCAEEVIRITGGYCILSSLVPFYCETLEEVLEVARLSVRFLIRINFMDAIYSDETKRTNRIGIGLTAIHEFAWRHFGLGFRQMLDSNFNKYFWDFISKLRVTVENEAKRYSEELGVNVPHTVTTIKPDGSISKLFGLTEGAHLPAFSQYMRWVQFQSDDPLVQKNKDKGYPAIECTTYPNMTRVGFPTIPAITKLGMGKNLVTASEATPEEQYQYLMLLEKHWLGEGNAQISYTMKVDKSKVDQQHFNEMLFKYQSQIRCCSVMPVLGENELKNLYEYMPEEAISEDEFVKVVANIHDDEMNQVLDISTLYCQSGACPL